MPRLAISLFSGGGIGDLGLHAAGIHTAVANEFEEDRASLLALNNPDCEVIVGDIWERTEQIIGAARRALTAAGEEHPFLIFATPPCQGMSSNGRGSILRGVTEGTRPRLDPRNRLIIPALKIARDLRPEFFAIENVPGMLATSVLNEQDELVMIMDLIPAYLGPEYRIEHRVINVADYGVPQRRTRLFVVATRHPAGIATPDLYPKGTHGREAMDEREAWVTVDDAIGGFAPLDARSVEGATDPRDPLHCVPVMDPTRYWWVANTPAGEGAFDNQCVNPECRFQGNPVHGSEADEEGVVRSKQDTPIYCLECGSLLPRPVVEDKDGALRLMKGYRSSYRRMRGEQPSATLTRNLQVASSDNKLHPTQNRVLSIAEASTLQTISGRGYRWGPVELRGKAMPLAPLSLIRDIIGESVPPLFVERLMRHLVAVTER